MKILVLQDYLRSGGTERQAVLLSNAFAAAGHATTLLTFRPGGELEHTVDSAVHRHILQPFDLHLDWFAPGLYRAVESNPPDVTLCMGRMANCWGHAVVNVLADRWPRSAVVCTMRTGKKLPWLFRRSLHSSRHVVANSAAARDTLVARYSVAAEKISVIRNSLVFPSAPALGRNDQLREQHGASPSTTVLLNVAMFRPEKNHRELIEIAAGLPVSTDWQLWLAGDGPARRACEQLVSAKNLGARVKFLGHLRDPSPLYTAADFAVLASSSESLSNFLIEAQAHGLPVVACEAQGVEECFVPGRTGWSIPHGDHAAFRSALVRLMTEPADARTQRAAEARAFAHTAFDYTRQVAAYLELFSRLLSPN